MRRAAHSATPVAEAPSLVPRVWWVGVLLGLCAVLAVAAIKGTRLGQEVVAFVCHETPMASSPLCNPDPRQELIDKMGISWSEDNFWAAVRRGDERATELFLKGGMTINSVRLHEVLIHPQVSMKSPLHLIEQLAPNRNTEFCAPVDDATTPSAHDTPSRFAAYADNERASHFVRRFCAGYDIAGALRLRYQAEIDHIKSIEARNSATLERQESCTKALSSSEIANRLAPKDVPYGGCYQPKDIKSELEQEFCQWRLDNVSGASQWHRTVRRFCSTRHRLATADTTMRDRLGRAVLAFSK